MRVFVDTNIVLYALLPDDPRKQALAQELLHRHSRDRSLWLSTQVLLEAYSVLTRKRKLVPADALAAVQLLASRQVAPATPEGTLRALALSARYRLSPWDAAIVQAAMDAGCETLYTEDLQDGQHFEALRVVNPFELKVQETAPLPAAPMSPVPAKGRAAKVTARGPAAQHKTRP